MICRVDRVTESGGDVGRLNVVGGAEDSVLCIAVLTLTANLALHQQCSRGGYAMLVKRKRMGIVTDAGGSVGRRRTVVLC